MPSSKPTICIFFLSWVLPIIVCSSVVPHGHAQDEMPSTKFEAITWLENERNTVTKNGKGEVTEIIIDYVPDIFVVGDLDIFPKLEKLKINYTGSFYDRHMSGIARLQSLKVFDADYCDEISESSLSVLRYLPKLEEVRLRNCEAIYSLNSLIDCRGIKKIDLSYNEHFDFDALRDLSRFTNLESISLMDNSTLEDKHLRWLGEVKTLKELKLNSCSGISDDGIQQLSGLKKLKVLDLSSNIQLKGETLESLSESLEELNLESCGLTKVSLGKLIHLKALRKLKILNNEGLKGSGFEVFSNFEKLEELNLSTTTVSDAQLINLAGLKLLKEIDLSGCTKISGVGLAALTNSVGVTSISLDGCRRVGNEALEEVAKFTKLKKLGLTGTKAKPEGLQSLVGLKELKHLDLSKCNFIDDQCMKTVAALSSLESLRLCEIHRLTDEGIKHLALSTSIEYLEIGKNKNITMTGLSEFRTDGPLKDLTIESLPKLSVSGLRNCRRLENLEELEIAQKKISSELLNSLKGCPRLKTIEVSGEYDSHVYRQLLDSLPSLISSDD